MVLFTHQTFDTDIEIALVPKYLDWKIHFGKTFYYRPETKAKDLNNFTGRVVLGKNSYPIVVQNGVYQIIE